MATPIDEYRIYLDATVLLAKTLVIKSDDAATLMNTDLMERYGASSVDTTNPYSWKYYLNISGEYHDTDTLMTVISLDTLEEIPFTKGMLADHTATAAAYAYGSRYYHSLVQAYPDQENLIHGILYPANLTYAVEAQNGSIVALPEGWVEPQEATLLYELEQWIQRYLARWHVRAFIHSDTLYAAAQWGVMSMQLVPELLNLRLKRCHTPEAHSFHIRQYLAQHGRLDRYWDYMTLEQALFLYRNIRYLQHKVGQRTTLSMLIEAMLSKRYIPIADYTMNQLTVFDSDYYPSYHFRKQPINGSYNMPRKDTFTLDELLKREQMLAPGNANLSVEEWVGMDKAFKTSVSGVVQTKDMESSLIDYTDAVPWRLTDVLAQYWLYCVGQDRYPVLVNYRDPIVGESRSLTARAALIYAVYLTAYRYGIPLETIPNLQARRIVRPSGIDRAVLRDGTTVRVVRDKDLQAILSTIPRFRTFYSKTAFYAWGLQLFQTEQRWWYSIARLEDMHQRAQVDWVVEQLHHDPMVILPESGMAYQTWLSEHNLPVATYSPTEVQLLIQTLFTAATGYRKDPTKSAANIQRAMLGILKQFSSYSIQTIAQVNVQPVRLIEWASIRTGHSRVQIDAKTPLTYGVYPQAIRTALRSHVAYDESTGPLRTVRSTKHGRTAMDLSSLVRASHTLYGQHVLMLPRFTIDTLRTIRVTDTPEVRTYALAHPSTRFT